ncbi:acyl-CoA dehydrogenase [Duganella sp. FT92W]|uniref:Acyl-CoA dehydrogenase n=1 Tax=Pseudoduganella rivuli TaxID=2666085 RepID=A0A7X2IL07_9BURK|nr:acyl-CoA dehydrogenase [Pseudoduganella rivuli]MRV71765.1 acyl-CoA dehydrogenase [Pseudoduganella rivuli]
MPQPAVPDFPVLSPADDARLRRHAGAADGAGFLHPVQQALIHRRGWLRMLAPLAAGGMEWPLPKVVRLEEAVARADGSAGWVVTLCAGAGWFAGFLPPDIAREVMATRRVCPAGSGAPTGYADVEGDGYRLTGRWDYASGAPMATHFTLNAVLRDGGKPLLDEQGAPRIRAFLVPARHVRVEPTWNMTGLRGTASHSYRIDGQLVSAGYSFAIAPEAATAPGPLYRFPFYSLAYVTLAANVAGMAAHFMALAGDCLAHRRLPGTQASLAETPAVQRLSATLHVAFDDAHAMFYAALDDAWARVVEDGALGVDGMVTLKTVSLALVRAARDAVDGLYPYCGLHAAREDSDINRVWRDFHTASQHTLLLDLD